MQSYIIDLTSENFQEVLLQGKYSQPIVIDFWSERAPENQVSPRLLNIAQSLNGQIILARLNCDRHPELVQQFGIQSLPTVAIFKDGKPVDSFAGEQDEAAIREVINRHLPKQEEVLLQQAQILLMDSKFAEAVPLAGQAYELAPLNTDIKIAYAQSLLGSHQMDAAEALLATFLVEEKNHQYQTLCSHLELAKKAAETPEILALQTAYEQNPADLKIAYDLAIQLQAVNKHAESVALLFGILQTEYDFLEGAARKTFLDVLAVMTDAQLVADYRRKLYSLMY
ncbi:MAG: putative thioredoxin [Moritella sp.]